MPGVSLVAPIPDDSIVTAEGQVVAVGEATTDQLAYWLDAVKEGRSYLQWTTAAVTREILGRMDRRGKWTVQVGGFKLSAPSPDAGGDEYDGELLRDLLLDLAAGGVIDEDLVDDAVEEVITYKVRKAGVNALKKIGGKGIDRALAKARVEADQRTRRVSVSRAS